MCDGSEVEEMSTAIEVLGTEATRWRYLEIVEKRAQRQGLESREVIDNDIRSMGEAEHPGPDCLEPHEVEEYVRAGSLSDTAKSHVSGCPDCEALLIAAMPDQRRDDEFAEEIRELLPCALDIAI